jgi:transcriptional regulator with XRE-family HTH domain
MRSNCKDALDIHIGQRLKQRRLELGFGQAELSKHLGLSVQQIRKYENGEQSISVSVLYMICDKLQVEYSYFFFGFSSGIIYDDNAITSEINELTRVYRKIDNAEARLMLRNIVKEIYKYSQNHNDYRLDDEK